MALIDEHLLSQHLLCLGLDSSVSAKELKKAYGREIQKWHPDHYHDDPIMEPIAHERAVKINAAHEYLYELFEKGALPRSTPHVSTTPQSKTKEAYRTQHTYKGKPFTPGFREPNVFEVFVKSSHIISAGYNRKTGTMYIKFEGDRVYAYHNVPESVFIDFMEAESHGKFAHRHIYGRYPYVEH